MNFLTLKCNIGPNIDMVFFTLKTNKMSKYHSEKLWNFKSVDPTGIYKNNRVPKLKLRGSHRHNVNIKHTFICVLNIDTF